MKIESFKNYGQPYVVEASRLLVRDDVTGNPVCCVIEFAPGQFWVTHQGDDKFDKALELLGVQDKIVTDIIDPAQFNSDGSENLWLPKN